ncbi:MAG: ABC transporter permease [Arthrobacter sp.]|jgi:peptide/nickel transport system permease protein|nr:ABC transporter permease [Arthrobacter sp.]
MNTPETPEALGASVAAVEDAQLAAKQDSLSQGRLVWRRFIRHKPAMISAAVLVLLIIVSMTSIGIFGIKGWWPYDFKTTSVSINGGVPSAQHWFGQEDIGRDYFALVMSGTQVSLIVAFLVGISGTVLGTLLGAIAGYYRGWIDSIIMRIADIFFVIPLLLIAAIVAKTASGAISSPWFLGIMLGVVSWAGLARLVRAQVLTLREREYVEAARAMGASSWRIILKHLIPNCIGTVLVNATLATASAVLLETSLSFLGFGVKAPDSSLGLLISQYQNSFTTRPWLFWWPGLIILIIALSVNFIGDGLRDAFDPRQSGRVKKRNLAAAALMGIRPIPVPTTAERAELAARERAASGPPRGGAAGPVDAAETERTDEEEGR